MIYHVLRTFLKQYWVTSGRVRVVGRVWLRQVRFKKGSKYHLYNAHCQKESHGKKTLPMSPFGSSSQFASFKYTSGNDTDFVPAKVCPIPGGGYEMILNPVLGTDAETSEAKNDILSSTLSEFK